MQAFNIQSILAAFLLGSSSDHQHVIMPTHQIENSLRYQMHFNQPFNNVYTTQSAQVLTSDNNKFYNTLSQNYNSKDEPYYGLRGTIKKPFQPNTNDEEVDDDDDSSSEVDDNDN